MADSGSLRVRRHRLHKAGDHSLCHRCDPKRAQLADLSAAWDAAAIPTGRAGEIPHLDAVDRQLMLEGLALRLEKAHKADPADTGVARELRVTLQVLGAAGQADDETAKFLADFSKA